MSSQFPESNLYKCRRDARQALSESSLGSAEYNKTKNVLDFVEKAIKELHDWGVKNEKIREKTQAEFSRAVMNGPFHKPGGSDYTPVYPEAKGRK